MIENTKNISFSRQKISYSQNRPFVSNSLNKFQKEYSPIRFNPLPILFSNIHFRSPFKHLKKGSNSTDYKPKSNYINQQRKLTFSNKNESNSIKNQKNNNNYDHDSSQISFKNNLENIIKERIKEKYEIEQLINNKEQKIFDSNKKNENNLMFFLKSLQKKNEIKSEEDFSAKLTNNLKKKTNSFRVNHFNKKNNNNDFIFRIKEKVSKEKNSKTKTKILSKKESFELKSWENSLETSKIEESIYNALNS